MTAPIPDTAGDDYIAPPWAFDADLTRMNAKLEQLGAIVTLPDGWCGIDPSKAPADLIRAYEGLASYGYANSLLQ